MIAGLREAKNLANDSSDFPARGEENSAARVFTEIGRF